MADPTFSAFAGVNNTLSPERLHSLPSRDNPTCDLVVAVNVDIDNSGQVARRVGTTQKVAGAAHSIWALDNDCLYVQGTTLKRLNADFSSTTLATGLTAELPLVYVPVNGRVYWSNGLQTGVYADGGARSWGIAMPDAPGLQAISGTLAAGTYQAVVTLVRGDGQESGAGMASAITLVDGSGLRVSWDIPLDLAITTVHIYLTEPNGEVLYQATEAPAADGSVELTSANRFLPLDTQWLDAPPPGQDLTLHRGRIIIAAGAFLFGTTALGYEYVDLRDYLAIDGTKIRFVIGVEHGLYVATEKQVFFLAGDRLEDMSLKTVVNAAGVARSAVLADGFAVTGNQALAGQQVALFATGDGICMGTPDGQVVHLSRDRYRFTATASGAACFRQTDTLNQYLLFMS